MTKERIRASIPRMMAQVIPDEGLSSFWGHIPMREQVGGESTDFPGIVMELRRRYRVGAPGDDYIQLGALYSSMTYLGPRTKDL